MNDALKKSIDEILKLAFKEDSTKKDITSSLLLTNKKISAVIKFKEKGMLCGKNIINYIFSKFKNETHLKATFHCSIALIGDDKKLICSGKVKGSIIPANRGNSGFGYDPFFIPENNSKTFAEMEIQEKMIMSHRFNAFKVLANQIL